MVDYDKKPGIAQKVAGALKLLGNAMKEAALNYTPGRITSSIGGDIMRYAEGRDVKTRGAEGTLFRARDMDFGGQNDTVRGRLGAGKQKPSVREMAETTGKMIDFIANREGFNAPSAFVSQQPNGFTAPDSRTQSYGFSDVDRKLFDAGLENHQAQNQQQENLRHLKSAGKPVRWDVLQQGDWRDQGASIEELVYEESLKNIDVLPAKNSGPVLKATITKQAYYRPRSNSEGRINPDVRMDERDLDQYELNLANMKHQGKITAQEEKQLEFKIKTETADNWAKYDTVDNGNGTSTYRGMLVKSNLAGLLAYADVGHYLRTSTHFDPHSPNQFVRGAAKLMAEARDLEADLDAATLLAGAGAVKALSLGYLDFEKDARNAGLLIGADSRVVNNAWLPKATEAAGTIASVAALEKYLLAKGVSLLKSTSIAAAVTAGLQRRTGGLTLEDQLKPFERARDATTAAAFAAGLFQAVRHLPFIQAEWAAFLEMTRGKLRKGEKIVLTIEEFIGWLKNKYDWTDDDILMLRDPSPNAPKPKNYPFGDRPFWSGGPPNDPIENAYRHIVKDTDHPGVFGLSRGNPEYVPKAHELLNNIEQQAEYLKIDPQDGTYRYYSTSVHPEGKGVIISVYPDGRIRTVFIPKGQHAYFAQQPGQIIDLRKQIQ